MQFPKRCPSELNPTIDFFLQGLGCPIFIGANTTRVVNMTLVRREQCHRQPDTFRIFMEFKQRLTESCIRAPGSGRGRVYVSVESTAVLVLPPAQRDPASWVRLPVVSQYSFIISS